jgi:hypothetical protein
MHMSADGPSYVSRLVEFLSCLRAGYAFPQWATDFRAGLGSPYFSYYQPGFFYVASVFATMLPPVRAIGVALGGFSLLGYSGMLRLVGDRFGASAGVLAGSALLLSTYSITEVYQRGDFSEYAGMMTLPVLLHWLTGWLEGGRPSYWRALAVGCAALIVLHCVGGLLGYGVLALTTLWYAAATRSWRRALWAVAALVAGCGMAAFYLLPLAFEWKLVQGDRAALWYYHYSRHFVDPLALVGAAPKRDLVPVYLGPVVPALIAVSTTLLVALRRRVSRAERRLVVAAWVIVAVSVFMIGPASDWVWATLPLVGRIQFPWRFLLVLTVATSALAGSMVAWQRVAMVAGIAALVGTTTTDITNVRAQQLPATTRDIASVYFIPDVMDEWLPTGAVHLDKNAVPREPRCEPSCTVEGFARDPGRLRVRVVAEGEARLVLPHYFFPVGWRATLDGRPAPLEATPEGLMLLRLPGGGLVELTFTMTPMRRLGVVVSALTLAGWLVMLRRGRPSPAAPDPSSPSGA